MDCGGNKTIRLKKAKGVVKICRVVGFGIQGNAAKCELLRRICFALLTGDLNVFDKDKFIKQAIDRKSTLKKFKNIPAFVSLSLNRIDSKH